MAYRVVLRQAQIRNFLTNPNGPVVRDLERRAQNVLQKAKELAPADQGTLRDSLQIVRTTQRGKPILRVVSTVPYSQAVVRGTGGYSGIPPFGPGSALHLWGSSKGMKFHQLRGLARKIAANGTEGESGNIVGNPRHDGGPKDWLTVALQEASR